MPVSIDGVRQRIRPRGTFELLEDIQAILGTTADSFWPFLESTGTKIIAYKQTNRDFKPSDESAVRTLQSEFAPYEHVGGVHSYYFDVTGNQHLAGVDIADFSRVGDAISVGCWCFALNIASVALIAKWDNVATTAREWILWINASNKLEWQESDESASASIRRESSASIVQGAWTFCVAANIGAGNETDIEIYIDGVRDDGTELQTGTFVDMEALAAPVLIGAMNVTAVPANEFNGRIALPFITGKKLIDAEVMHLYQIGRELLGV